MTRGVSTIWVYTGFGATSVGRGIASATEISSKEAFIDPIPARDLASKEGPAQRQFRRDTEDIFVAEQEENVNHLKVASEALKKLEARRENLLQNVLYEIRSLRIHIPSRHKTAVADIVAKRIEEWSRMDWEGEMLDPADVIIREIELYIKGIRLEGLTFEEAVEKRYKLMLEDLEGGYDAYDREYGIIRQSEDDASYRIVLGLAYLLPPIDAIGPVIHSHGLGHESIPSTNDIEATETLGIIDSLGWNGSYALTIHSPLIPSSTAGELVFIKTMKWPKFHSTDKPKTEEFIARPRKGKLETRPFKKGTADKKIMRWKTEMEGSRKLREVLDVLRETRRRLSLIK